MRRMVLVLAVLTLATACVPERPKPPLPPEMDVANSLADGADVDALAKALGIPASFEHPFGIRFVLVPSGRLTMGSPRGEPNRGDDELLHEVTIRNPYYMAVSTWVAESGSYDDAREAAAAFAAEDPGHVYRLPTEAEWAFACRAGSTAAVAETTEGRNALGLIGMTDPLGEWCADWHAPYPPQAVADPIGPREGSLRVVRGGARFAARRALAPTSPGLGCRLVAEVGYGGRVSITFRSVERDESGQATRDAPGYAVRIISILDRLSDRQAGRLAEWTEISGRTPMTLAMRPGRYYAYCYEVASGQERRGGEQKFHVEVEPHDVILDSPDR